MNSRIWSVGLVTVVLAGGVVWGATQNNGASETRSKHGHKMPIVQQQTQPPLLSYVPKYYEHVKPIFDRSCVGCHSAGNIAPFALETAAQVAPMARTIQKAVQSKYMPPVTAGGSTPAIWHDKRLSPDEIAIIANWAWAGAPLGKIVATQAVSSSQKRQPDMVLTPKSEFLPDASLTDEYRCFIFDPKLSESRFMNAYNIVPANKKIVHHVVIFQIDKSKAEGAVQLENKTTDGRLGYPCFGGPGNNLGTPNIVGVWAPGQGSVDYPAGTGTQINPGDVLVLQLHYNLLGGKGSDQSKAELYFAPKEAPIKRLNSGIILAPVEIPCLGAYPTDPSDPCHRDAAYARAARLGDGTSALFKNPIFVNFCGSTVEQFTSGSAGKVTNKCTFPMRLAADSKLAIYGMLGHMHLLGQAIKLELIRENKSQTILEIPRWDFHWQSSYWLEKPIDLQNGDQVRVTCQYDNAPEVQPEIGGTRVKPRYTVWGEGTVDEMCLGILQIGQR